MRGLCLESQLAWSRQDQWVDQNIALLPKKVDIWSFLKVTSDKYLSSCTLDHHAGHPLQCHARHPEQEQVNIRGI